MNSTVKKFLSLALILWLPVSCIVLAQEAVVILENKDVIAMVSAGLKSDVIVARIKSAHCQFDTDPSVLAELRQKGVPDEVLSAMAEFSAVRPAAEGDLARQPHEEASARIVDLIVTDGTTVEIEMAETVDPREAEEGDLVRFRVARAVKVEEVIVIARGAAATARVVKAGKDGNWGPAGTPAWQMQDVVTVDGSRIPLQFSQGKKGANQDSADATGMIVAGLLYWPAVPLSGLKNDNNGVIPVGERFEASVHGDSSVKANIPVSHPETEMAADEADSSAETSPDASSDATDGEDAAPARSTAIRVYPRSVRSPEGGNLPSRRVITDIRNRRRVEGFTRRSARQRQ